MRTLAVATAVALVLVAVPAAVFGVILLMRDGYESAAPHFVGSLLLGGAALAVLAAALVGRFGRRPRRVSESRPG